VAPGYGVVVRIRPVLIAILVASIVALATMAQLREVQRSGFEWTPGLITVIVLILAVSGRPLAWGIAFGLAAVGTAVEAAWALGNLDEAARLAVTSVGLITCLALWGLRPEEADEAAASPAPPTPTP
jgi:hypothetical protein